MRTAGAILATSIAALTVLAAPAQAANSDHQKTETQAASSTCSSYQRKPDGTWMAIPCQPVGRASSPRQTTATRNSDDDARRN